MTDTLLKNERQVPLIVAVLPVVALIFFLVTNVVIFGNDSLTGPNQLALIFSATIAAIIATARKKKWEFVLKNIVNRIGSSMPAILILLLIGSLAGTWLLSGIIPVIIYYGLDIIHPKFFLVATVLVCSLVSVATGSSWTTVATVGLALNGIGQTMGIHHGIVAGAIISGAYFGDKMSPLSDTTNLAPAMAGTDIFTHVRYMMYTTIPSYTLTIIIFLIIGISYNFGDLSGNINVIKSAISTSFNITPLLLLVPILLILIIAKKAPPVPALLAGAVIGGIFAVIFQPEMIGKVAGVGGSYIKSSYVAVMKAIFGEISVKTENAMINDLLKSKGMAGMLNTVWIILSAMIFGGAMEAAGLLKRIAQSIIRFARSTGSLVASTVASCIFFNIVAADQYFSIVIPGRMFAGIYKDKGLKPELLSRTLEDSGTLTSVLVPWNTCEAFQSQVLGVPVLTYLPYCFLNLLNPVFAIIIAYANFKIRRMGVDEKVKK